MGSLGETTTGGCHDQADTEWIVIRGPLRGHTDTPFRRPTPGRPIGRPGLATLGVIGVFSYYLLVMLFLNMVCHLQVARCVMDKTPHVLLAGGHSVTLTQNVQKMGFILDSVV
jgi:hypothetical protein